MAKFAIKHPLFISAALIGSLGIALAQMSGCQKNSAPSDIASNPQTSAIHIKATVLSIQIETPSAQFEFFPSGYLKASLKRNKQLFTFDDPGQQSGSGVRLEGKTIADFSLDLSNAQVRNVKGKLGNLGKHIEIKGSSLGTKILETLTIEIYDDFPETAFLSATYQNNSNQELRFDSVSLQNRQLNASLSDPQVAPHDMWSFFGSSLKWGKDEVLRIPAKFSQENPFSLPVAVGNDLGGAGGGIPVVAFWTKNMGMAIGHIETLPLVLSIPVETQSNGLVSTSVRMPVDSKLKPGEIYSTPRTFVNVFSGDFYEPLQQWANILEHEGLKQPSFNSEDYAISWCSWGYRSDINAKKLLDAIPKLKELGIHWATLDDGWFDNYGDWKPRQETFPADDIQKMVKKFHDEGIKVQLWWLPLGVEDGTHHDGAREFILSDVVQQHRDWLVLGKDGKPARMTRNLAVLCPAVPAVQAYYKQLTERFIRDWDFDGHKLDNIFAVPQCFNPAHHHKSPNDSVYAMGDVYKIIFETTRALKPDSVTQSCPCGTPPSLAWFRYMDQAVSADPINSAQVRRRIKMYKALMGPRAAIYGDHVELTRLIDPDTPKAQQLGVDFASSLGTGGVLGTKFTLPEYKTKFPYSFLSPQKEAYWKNWIAIYNDKMLSKGDFQDLYTYGYDVPEAYAIKKDGIMYYAFYSSSESPALSAKPNPKNIWKGEVELRGLQPGSYKVVDYVHHRELGVVHGPTAKLKVEFSDSLLIQTTPIVEN